MSLRDLFSAGRKQDGAVKRDPRKAQRFFEHAQTVADAHNYDYAIELYISGLRHDPDNMRHHEALREVALRRKVGGGKPAGFTARLRSRGATPVDRMLQIESVWAKDPLNTKLMREFMEAAIEASEAEPDLNLSEVAHWAGGLALEFASQGAKTDRRAMVQLRDLFARIGSYAEATEACKVALRFAPNDDQLLMDLKNLEAERTMQEGGYSAASQSEEEGGFRRVVRDMDKQTALDQEDRIVKRSSDVEQLIERARSEHEQDPENLDKLGKLVDALLNKDDDDHENEAITLLQHAWEQSGQYRHKMRIGDVRMKQFNRHLRQLKQQSAQATGDEAERLKQRMRQVNQKRLAFELEEYQERVKHYPTDLALRHELGRRLFYTGQIDEAISAFQQAKNDPKHRSVAHQYLGTCYISKGWHEEAIETLRAAIEQHGQGDDRLGMELRYLLMDALERRAREQRDPELAREAQKLASQILQTKIDFRDIQNRLEKIRGLVDELAAKSEAG